MRKILTMALVLTFMLTLLTGISVVQAADASVLVYTETFSGETASTTSKGTAGTIMENSHFSLRSWSPENYIYDGASYGVDGTCYSITPDGSTGNTRGGNIMLDFKDTVPANAKTITFQMDMRANTIPGGYFSLVPNGDSFGLGATTFADGGTAQVFGPDGNGQIGATWADGGGWTRLTYTYNMIAHTLSFEAYTPDTDARNTQTFTAKDDAQWEAIGLGDIDENGHTIRINLDSGVNRLLLDNISLSYTLPGESTITATTDGHGVLQKDGATVSSFQVADGTTVTMTAVADSGYELAEVLVNGTAVATDNGAFTVAVNGDTAVKAVFKKAGTIWSYDFTDAPEGKVATNGKQDFGEVTSTEIGNVYMANWWDSAYIVNVNGNKMLSNSDATASNALAAQGSAAFRFFWAPNATLPTGATEMVYSWYVRANDGGSGDMRFELGDDNGNEDTLLFVADGTLQYVPNTAWANIEQFGAWDADHEHTVTVRINNVTGKGTVTVYDMADGSTDTYTTDTLGTQLTYIALNNQAPATTWKMFVDNIQVSYSTAKPSYTIYPNNQTGNGKILYNGAEVGATVTGIEYGSDVTFKLVADENYEIDFVQVSDQMVTPNADGEFTLSNVTKNMSFQVAFKETTRAEASFAAAQVQKGTYTFGGEDFASAVIFNTITRPTAWAWNATEVGVTLADANGTSVKLAAADFLQGTGNTTAQFGIRVFGAGLVAGDYTITPYATNDGVTATGSATTLTID